MFKTSSSEYNLFGEFVLNLFSEPFWWLDYHTIQNMCYAQANMVRYCVDIQIERNSFTDTTLPLCLRDMVRMYGLRTLWVLKFCF